MLRTTRKSCPNARTGTGKILRKTLKIAHFSIPGPRHAPGGPLPRLIKKIASGRSLTMENLFSLEGRTALITGGSRGIGEMIAEGYLRAGAKVYISSRKAEDCFETAERLSQYGECIPLPEDVSGADGASKRASGFNSEWSFRASSKSSSEELVVVAVGGFPKAFLGDAGKEVPLRGENDERLPPLVAAPGWEDDMDARPSSVFIASGGPFSESSAPSPLPSNGLKSAFKKKWSRSLARCSRIKRANASSFISSA